MELHIVTVVAVAKVADMAEMLVACFAAAVVVGKMLVGPCLSLYENLMDYQSRESKNSRDPEQTFSYLSSEKMLHFHQATVVCDD